MTPAETMATIERLGLCLSWADLDWLLSLPHHPMERDGLAVLEGPRVWRVEQQITLPALRERGVGCPVTSGLAGGWRATPTEAVQAFVDGDVWTSGRPVDGTELERWRERGLYSS